MKNVVSAGSREGALAVAAYNKWCAERSAEYRTDRNYRLVDTREILRAVIDEELTPTERRALEMCRLEGVCMNEVASSLKLSRSAAYGALGRAEKKIRAAMKYIMRFPPAKFEIDGM